MTFIDLRDRPEGYTGETWRNEKTGEHLGFYTPYMPVLISLDKDADGDVAFEKLCRANKTIYQLHY